MREKVEQIKAKKRKKKEDKAAITAEENGSQQTQIERQMDAKQQCI